jgi:gluconate 5-dehydrogenase
LTDPRPFWEVPPDGFRDVVETKLTGSFLVARAVVPRMLARVMAADLTGSPVTVNILLPGGATATGMIPEGIAAESRGGLLDPAVMGPPIVWLASPDAGGIHGERIVATEFEAWLATR